MGILLSLNQWFVNIAKFDCLKCSPASRNNPGSAKLGNDFHNFSNHLTHFIDAFIHWLGPYRILSDNMLLETEGGRFQCSGVSSKKARTDLKPLAQT
jgi:hypothetical protein